MNMPKQNILILFWVFETDNIVNNEYEMSTAKSLCYIDPQALVSKRSATKNGEKRPSVPPWSPLCRPRYLTDSAHISYTYC